MAKKKNSSKTKKKRSKDYTFELNQISVVAIVGLVVVALAFMATVNTGGENLYGFASDIIGGESSVIEINGLDYGDIVSGVVNFEVNIAENSDFFPDKIAVGIFHEEQQRMIEWTWIEDTPYVFDSNYDQIENGGWDTSYSTKNGEYTLWVLYSVENKFQNPLEIPFTIDNEVVTQNSFNLPNTYTINSNEDVTVFLDYEDRVKTDRVLFHAFTSDWKLIEGSGMQDTAHPYVYASDKLDQLPEGEIYVQAILYGYTDNVIEKVTDTLTVVHPSPAPIKTGWCGDGILNPGEICELTDKRDCTAADGYDGSQVCDEFCQGYEQCDATESCGDGIVNGFEQCDDGNNVDSDSCSNVCISNNIGSGGSSPDFIVIEAETGNLNGFLVDNGAIYQTDYRLEVDGGNPTATYTFTVTTEGNYEVSGLVKATTTDSDSFFVNIDSLPTGTNNIWDIPRNTDFTKERVIWREDQNVLFYLTPGQHTLHVTGREPDVYADKWYIKLDGVTICGDGDKTGNEVCDGDKNCWTSEGYVGTQTCTSCTSLSACSTSSYCGDGVVQKPEQCDDGPGGECPDDCKYVISTVDECNDGEDNDGDGLFDFADNKGATEGEAGVSLGCLGPNRKESDVNNGFYSFNLHPNARVIYVSDSEGSDSNDGLSPQSPVKTLNAGYNKIRHNTGDWLLLKADDDFYGQPLIVSKSGLSSDYKQLIGVYGAGPRPRLHPGYDRRGIDNANHHRLKHIAISGLEFPYDDRDPDSPAFVAAPGNDIAAGINFVIPNKKDRYVTDLLIQDNLVEHADTGIRLVDSWPKSSVPQAPGRISAVLHRNIVKLSSSFGPNSDSHSVGIYVEGTINSEIKENCLDHNGWTRTQTSPNGAMARNKRSHNIYAQSYNQPINVHNNMFFRAAAHALQLRAGGNVDDNLFVENPMQFWTGIHDSTARRNVVLDGTNMWPGQLTLGQDARGWGINGGNDGMRSYIVEDNYVLNRLPNTMDKMGIEVAASAQNVRRNTVYNWKGKSNECGYTGGVSILAGWNCDIMDNRNGNRVLDTFDRNLKTYSQAIGLPANNEAFMDIACSRPRGTWDPKFSAKAVYDYIKDGTVPQ